MSSTAHGHPPAAAPRGHALDRLLGWFGVLAVAVGTVAIALDVVPVALADGDRAAGLTGAEWLAPLAQLLISVGVLALLVLLALAIRRRRR